MKKVLCLFAALAVFGSADAQTSDDARMRQIWAAAERRMSNQCDEWFDDGDFPRTIQLIQFRLRLDPANYETATDLGWLLESTDRFDEALAVYVAFRKANTDTDANAPWPEANYYFARRQFDKVPPLLEPTLGRNPHPNSFRLTAHAYDRLGKYADAKRIWETYLAKNPNDETAKVNLQRVIKKMAGG